MPGVNYRKDVGPKMDKSARTVKRRSGSTVLHPDPTVERLIRAADGQSVATEMIAVLGFLLEKQSLTSYENDNLQEYKHPAGFSFTCLRVFRDWCYVTPKKRQSWCQGRNFSNDVLESVCDYVTTVMKKLHPDTASERTTFRKDTKAVEKCILQLFLDEVSDSLSVYSGSPHLGYFRLSDRQKIRPPGVESFVTPPKYALLFTLSNSFPGKGKTVNKCTLYLTEELVEYIKTSENKQFINNSIDTFFNKVKVFKIMDVCPGVLTKLFSTEHSTSTFTEKVKTRAESKTCDLFFDVNFAKKSIAVHVLHPEAKENIVFDFVKDLLGEEKDNIMAEVVCFEYPQPGSGMSLQVLNGGKLHDVVVSSGANSKDYKRTVLVYIHGVEPNYLKIKETLQEYGRVSQVMSHEETLISKPESRLWGKLYCDSVAQARRLHTHNCDWGGFHQHVTLRSARPELRADTNSVDFIRLSVRSFATSVNKVTIHREGDSWVPAKKYVVIGKEPCKVWWCKNGDGVLSVDNQLISNAKINKVIRQAFGSSIGRYHQLTIDRSPETKSSFERQREIWNKFISPIADMNIHCNITLNKMSKDRVYFTDFVDLFECGRKFLHDHMTAKQKGFWIHDTEFYSVRMVRPEVYECVKTGIDVVCQTVAENRLGASLDASTDENGMVMLEIHGISEKDVKKVSDVIKKVISPQVVAPEDEMPENRGYLFPYLASCGGKNLMEKISRALDVLCLIQPNGDQLHIYGPPECKKDAKERIITFVKKLPRSVDIPAPNEELKISLVKYLMKLYGKDFMELCRQTGATSLFWNSKLRIFTVWGNSGCVDACRRKIEEASEFVSSATTTVSDRHTCCACLCPAEGTPFQLSLCGHVYCESCINVHVKIAIKDRSLPIPCVAEGCQDFILLNDIGRSCNYSKEGLRQLLDAAVSLFIAQTGESCPLRHCSAPDCTGLYFVSKDKYTGQEVNCGTCGTSVCNCCQVSPYHKGYTCALWKHREHLDDETAQWFSQDEDSRRMCPRCGVGIEKIDGCNNVHCTNCKCSICYRCMEHFNNSSLCYDHLTEEHGGPY